MYTFKDLVEITAKLRAEDGCPWDREQTFESLRKYMREEAEEAVQAVPDRKGKRAVFCRGCNRWNLPKNGAQTPLGIRW